jgi:hypothetical protein
MEYEHGPRRGRAWQQRAVDGEKSVVGSLRGLAGGKDQLRLVSGGTGKAERCLDGLLNLRAANQLRNKPPDGAQVQTEKPIRAGVRKEQPAPAVYCEHRFVHRTQDHHELLAVLIEPGGLSDHVSGHFVECTDQTPDRAPQRGPYESRPGSLAERLEPLTHINNRLADAIDQKRPGAEPDNERCNNEDLHSMPRSGGPPSPSGRARKRCSRLKAVVLRERRAARYDHTIGRREPRSTLRPPRDAAATPPPSSVLA